MHLWCYGLPVEKVRHHLLLAGIEGTTISTNPQQLGLLCDQGIASGTDRRWRAPLEFSKRGNLPGGTYRSHRLPSIPALPQHDHVLKQPRRFFPRHALTIEYSTILRTSGDGRGSAQGGHDYQTFSIRHPGRLVRDLTLLLDALALDPRLSAERTLGDVSLGAEESLRTQALWCGSDGPDDNPCRGHLPDLESGLASAMLDAPNGGFEPTAATE
jgi:hypothetical protein